MSPFKSAFLFLVARFVKFSFHFIVCINCVGKSKFIDLSFLGILFNGNAGLPP